MAEQNSTLLQGFEWNVPADGKHWARLREELPVLGKIGITNVWLPPGCKAAAPDGNGYDIYDLWDLGEFDQKGARRTKWGSKEELVELARAAKVAGIGLYWDAVLNHKAGADKTEKCTVVEVDPDDRTKEVSEPHEIEAWLGFTFDGRGGKYSTMQWNSSHFIGTDWDEATQKKAIYKIAGKNKEWAESVDSEHGNADYLMFADIDYHNNECRDDVKNWAVWITKELDLKGFRMDAVQHFSERYTNEWVKNLRAQCGDIFVVGEFWVDDAQKQMDWLENMGREFSIFDARLLDNFHRISTAEKADLRRVFDDSLVKSEPYNAVTVVMNHDTQPGQTVDTPIAGWFKPLGYALILLRAEGYPCVFYGDLYGMCGKHAEPPSCGGKLADLVLARKLYAYGEQEDYVDEEKNCIGWVRRGMPDRKFGLACVMSNAEPATRRMFVGEMHAGEKWTDVLGWGEGEVQIDGAGWAEFTCPGQSVAVWVNAEAEERGSFPVGFDSDIYRAR